jgi:hypothetical protein
MATHGIYRWLNEVGGARQQQPLVHDVLGADA